MSRLRSAREPLFSTLVLLGLLLFTPAARATAALDGIRVCLDPGHGGSDPGAVNQEFGLEESEINLDVSFGLKRLLEGAGATVAMTRVDESDRTNSDRYTFCNAAQATILISVHTNSVVDPTWDGSMTLYAPSRDADLATAIHDVMYPLLRDTAPATDAFIDFGVDNFASAVLFKCNMPAAMVEPLLMSHPAEAALLVQTIFPTENPAGGEFSAGCADFSCRRGDIAQAVFQGVLNYYGGGSTPTLHVSSIEMSALQRKDNFFVYAFVHIEDSVAQPVSGATVAHTFTLPDGSQRTATGITGEDGGVLFRLLSDLPGQYESAIGSVSKTGWVYQPADNLETRETLSVP